MSETIINAFSLFDGFSQLTIFGIKLMSFFQFAIVALLAFSLAFGGKHNE